MRKLTFRMSRFSNSGPKSSGEAWLIVLSGLAFSSALASSIRSPGSNSGFSIMTPVSAPDIVSTAKIDLG